MSTRPLLKEGEIAAYIEDLSREVTATFAGQAGLSETSNVVSYYVSERVVVGVRPVIGPIGDKRIRHLCVHIGGLSYAFRTP